MLNWYGSVPPVAELYIIPVESPKHPPTLIAESTEITSIAGSDITRPNTVSLQRLASLTITLSVPTGNPLKVLSGWKEAPPSMLN